MNYMIKRIHLLFYISNYCLPNKIFTYALYNVSSYVVTTYSKLIIGRFFLNDSLFMISKTHKKTVTFKNPKLLSTNVLNNNIFKNILKITLYLYKSWLLK